MSAVAVGVSIPPPARPRSGVLTVVVVSMVSVAAFVGIHAADTWPYAQFQGACERLRTAGLAITAQDTFCRPLPWTAHAGAVAGMLLFATGFVSACSILAATGRRGTAFIPFVAVPLGSISGVMISDRWWQASAWPHGALLGGVAMVLVIGAPVAAVAYAVRGRERSDQDRPSVDAGIASGAAVIVAAVAVAYLARAVLAHHFGSIASNWSFDGIVAGAIAMALFGALLGPDRLWWPWSLALPAILLSMGPSFALIVGQEHVRDWSQFGVVLPLFAIGVIASAWRPLALRLMRIGDVAGDTRDTIADVEPRAPSRQIRPTVALNAAAAGFLAVSLIIFRADPGPIQLATALPTYLGARNVVMDVRTKLDLRMALIVMDAYRADHGSYRGFDAAVGRAADPSLQWSDGVPPEAAVFGDDHPDVAIVSATSDQAGVVGLSSSGIAFCVQRSAGDLTYGSGVTPASAPPSGVTALHRAATACGSIPWSADAVRRFPIDGMCDGLDPTGGYLMCRVVQALMVNTMAGR
jgi:hypothetical protein